MTAHINKVDNPHSVTKAQVGLSNVLNVASYSKTESDTALALKLNKSVFDDLFEKVGGQHRVFTPLRLSLTSIPSVAYRLMVYQVQAVQGEVLISPNPTKLGRVHIRNG